MKLSAVPVNSVYGEAARSTGSNEWRASEIATEALPSRGPSGPVPVFPQEGTVGSLSNNVQAVWAPCYSCRFAYKVTSQTLPTAPVETVMKKAMKI